MKIKPLFKFNKYEIGLGIGLLRTNESKLFIRKKRCINYTFVIILLWFYLGLEIDLGGGRR